MDITLKDKNGVTLHTAKKHCKEDITVRVETQEISITPSVNEQIQEGLFNKVTVQGDEDLVAENIKKGKNIFGVEGGFDAVDTRDANATINDIAEGTTAYVNNQKIEGTVPNNGELQYEPSDEEQTIPAGITTGGTVKATDITKLNEYEACLTLANSIDNLDDYTETTATAEDIRAGKTAYSNGERITGTMEVTSGGGLSSDYQQLEYIQSNGTQYIDTGVNPKANEHSAVVVFKLTQRVNGKEQWAFGQWSDNGWRCGGTTSAAGSFSLDKSHGFNYLSSSYLDENVGMSAQCTITSDYPMLLFAQQEGGRAGYLENSYFRIYECKIWHNGKIIRDFIPCYRKEDGEAGMFDTVNKVFYTNQGTGTFIIGPEMEG